MLYSRDYIILLAALFFWFYLKHVHSEDEKNYVLKLKGWEAMEENNPYAQFKQMKMKKYNKTHYVMDGLIEIVRDDISADDLLVSVLGAQKKSNGFQQSSLVQLENKNFCEFIKNEKMFMEDIGLTMNYSFTDTCPPPKGFYSMSNYMPDPDKLPKSLPAAFWRLSVLNIVGETVLSGIHVYVEVDHRGPAD